MTYKFWLKASDILFLVSLLFWILETAYFGWNATAQSKYETWCDGAVNIGILTALMIRLETICSYVIKNHINRISETASKACDGNCGMNYCDENGCIERKRFLTPCPPGSDKPQCN
jgi:hypothetical protein